MTIQEIREKYWIEFLQWYKNYDGKSEQTKNMFDERRMRPVEDIFWYWLTCVRPQKGDEDFLNKLKETQ